MKETGALHPRQMKATLTLAHRAEAILPVPIAAYVLREPDARVQLRLQDVALVQEQHEVDVREQLVLADGLPEQDGVLLW